MDVLYQLRRVPSLKLFGDSKITTTHFREPRIEWKPEVENEYVQKWKEWSIDRAAISGTRLLPPTLNQMPNETRTTTITDTTESSEEITKATIEQEKSNNNNTNYTIVHDSNDSNNFSQYDIDMNNHIESPAQGATSTILGTGHPSPLISVTSLTSPQLLPVSSNGSQQNVVEEEDQLQDEEGELAFAQQSQREENNITDLQPKHNTNDDNNRNIPLQRDTTPSSDHDQSLSLPPLPTTPKPMPVVNHEIIFTRVTPYQQEQCK